jgi:hypothetical protein
MDKYEKLSKADFEKLLHEIDEQAEITLVEQFMDARSIEDLQKSFLTLANSESFQEFEEIIVTLKKL